MDLSRYLSVLSDLNNYSQNEAFKQLISQLINRIAENKQQTEIQASIDEVHAFTRASPVNYYTPSRIYILNKIGAAHFYGDAAFKFLSDILTKNYFNANSIIEELNAYLRDFSDCLERISRSYNVLTEQGFVPHKIPNDIFELGVILPTEVTHDEIILFEKQLHRWNLTVKMFNELTSGETSNPKLISIEKGSPLQVFIETYAPTAACIALAIERITAFYKTILEIRQLHTQLEEKTGMKWEAVSKHEKQLYNNLLLEIKKLIWDRFANKNVIAEEKRANELDNHLTKEIKFIAESISKGVDVEINAPQPDPEPIQKSESPSEEDRNQFERELEAYRQKLSEISEIRDHGSSLKNLPPRSEVFLSMLSEENSEFVDGDDKPEEKDEEKKPKKK